MIEEVSSGKKGGSSLAFEEKKRRKKFPSYLSRCKTYVVRIKMTFHNFSHLKITPFFHDVVSKGTITFFSIYKVLSHWKRHQDLQKLCQ